MSQHFSYIYLNCLEIFLRTLVDREYIKCRCTKQKAVLCWANLCSFTHILIHSSWENISSMSEVLCLLRCNYAFLKNNNFVKPCYLCSGYLCSSLNSSSVGIVQRWIIWISWVRNRISTVLPKVPLMSQVINYHAF